MKKYILAIGILFLALGGALWAQNAMYLSVSSVTTTGTNFAGLSTWPVQTNGTQLYCSNCTISTVCAAGGSGATATLLNGIWNCGNNAVTGSVPDPLSLNTLSATGSSPKVTGYSFIPGTLATSWLPQGQYGSSGLAIAPDSGSPTTTLDTTANIVTMVNPGTGKSLSVTAFSANDLVVGVQSGAVLNGRDQTAAFGTSAFYHLYAIGAIGQTAGVIASLTGPPTGPTLPANYTAWAYLGTFKTDGSGNVLSMYGRGNTDYYTSNPSVLSGGTATTSTNVAISSLVPAVASQYELYYNATGSSTSLGTFLLNLCIVTSTCTNANAFYPIGIETQVTTVVSGMSGWIEMPNISGGFYYRFQDVNSLTLANLNANIQLDGYRVPNNAS